MCFFKSFKFEGFQAEIVEHDILSKETLTAVLQHEESLNNS